MVEKFERVIERESFGESKIDLSLFRKRGNSKTYKNYLIQKIKEARQQGNLEVCLLIQHFYQKYLEFESCEKVRLECWKGKSSFKIIRKPKSFIVVKYQRPDKYSEPKEVRREIEVQEINWVLKCISDLNNGERIKTREIAEKVYGKKWKEIFADRYLHTQLNYILNIIHYYKLIDYRGGYTLVLNNVREIQNLLP